MSYGSLISFLPSSPHPKQSAFSSRAVLQTEHRTPAEHSPMWGLLPAGCGRTCGPILCFPFTLFYCATAQHCQFMSHWRSTVTSPEELLSHWLLPRQYWCQKLQGYSSVDLLELHTTTAASVYPRRQKCPCNAASQKAPSRV